MKDIEMYSIIDILNTRDEHVRFIVIGESTAGDDLTVVKLFQISPIVRMKYDKEKIVKFQPSETHMSDYLKNTYVKSFKNNFEDCFVYQPVTYVRKGIVRTLPESVYIPSLEEFHSIKCKLERVFDSDFIKNYDLSFEEFTCWTRDERYVASENTTAMILLSEDTEKTWAYPDEEWYIRPCITVDKKKLMKYLSNTNILIRMRDAVSQIVKDAKYSFKTEEVSGYRDYLNLLNASISVYDNYTIKKDVKDMDLSELSKELDSCTTLYQVQKKVLRETEKRMSDILNQKNQKSQ